MRQPLAAQSSEFYAGSALPEMLETRQLELSKAAA
jgi:hypothetical protein